MAAPPYPVQTSCSPVASRTFWRHGRRLTTTRSGYEYQQRRGSPPPVRTRKTLQPQWRGHIESRNLYLTKHWSEVSVDSRFLSCILALLLTFVIVIQRSPPYSSAAKTARKYEQCNDESLSWSSKGQIDSTKFTYYPSSKTANFHQINRAHAPIIFQCSIPWSTYLTQFFEEASK